ncbi:MAG TPA: hypothetical protein PLE73_12595 [Spirochaetota bacterium]|nr:hypothetical protein [Spirochaetota bacterium]HPI24031.1 hypothetical protein [Spirochaetota bacterium]HPU89407.1 hypothetical protein [Spirochaetota bacterium]
MTIRTITATILALVAAFCAACAQPRTAVTAAPEDPIHLLRNHSINPKSPLTFRVKMAPAPVLDYLRKLDQAPEYQNYLVRKSDMGQIATYLNLMPSKMRAVLQERLIGIYFINNFKGSGLTEWVRDERNNFYAFMVFNPDTLARDLSSWLTYRERSCFIANDPDISIEVDCGKKHTGFLYVLLHEAAHVVDYAQGITPYVEDSLKSISPARGARTPFVEGAWNGIRTPASPFDFPLRASLTFYGFGGGPKIPIARAIDAYRMLEKTPFVSLYGATSWAEDLADYAFFMHLTGALKQPYAITVRKKGSDPYSIRPAETARKTLNRPYPL